ncbi:protein phosphatase CheZ [Thalassolituus marinus]|uniref:Protein phosphatase CheZ n=1 Tax=Thalassolituus marinus TaxID=671053 RepID=A0ABS7ZM55_9GAMM|nr:protein phosphatase CheZ [Thalassolituus marinus]MCA6062804.1 protein phosphatase CheZ [Thalassolituus marinus]
MAGINLDTDSSNVGSEIRTLAENMIQQLERGNLGQAVALVNDLNEVRDRTLYNEIGRLTRALHEAIKNLRVDSVGAASEIDNATDKLTYVIEMTDKSANRTLDLADAGMPLATDIHERSTQLSGQWKKFLNKELKPEEFRSLTKDINQFLIDSAQQSRQLQGQLSDIVLAQDFQDLTGQVIHKVAALVTDVESRLVQLVAMAGKVDSITGISHADLEAEKAEQEEAPNITAEGPQIDKSSDDVVASQDDVDDLLSSLGF